MPNETELKAMPWARHLSLDEVAAYDLTRPFIKPQRIMTDNGKDYLSSTFMSACETFGVDITRSAIHTPTDKPNVERAFHTIKTKFVQYLPGNTGGSVDRRGAAVEKEDLLDIYTLAELFDRWVSVVWQNMTHEALRDPLDPRVIHSPNSMYMAMFDMTGFVPVPLSPEDYIALLPTLERTIQADGINVDYRRYDSPELGPYRLQPSGRSDTGGKWVIHYNPHNPAAVWVRHPETGEWMECRWMNKDAFEKPFSASIRRSARQITEAFGVLGDQESTEATVEMIAQTQNAKIGKARRDAAEAMEQVLAERSSKQFPRATTPLVVVPDVDILDDESYEEYSVFNPMKGSR
ncbi:Mu transposase C-terminal domain-containing protein [Arthrobacter sp. AK01]|uniref:Mu transposase C-terminal domain-containing protein n=1 Tax=Arthrobacter sp. AK01 TaxID=2894084 RepID=UPI001E35611F|nr:Mu transposase C-terminal domain-containing protein [Arthrobacter sp. AK01]MCD4849697.1 Mu transposase C-terminal domain-containing protein [Arthrobacter sp. AK01]